MKKTEGRKKENDGEDRWYARMNAIEALWRTKTAESRLEYKENFIKVNKKRSEFQLPRG